ncbi:DUF493 family protein [Dysgonomonas massiliensis]|uniref:DUF493 family protein n=1 Tax=Dysgonomonas massiliensis TaxID=2040292 RepID=UPI001FE30D70|nr:DUF493 family protein [Dysgonomonas massiliensis]
MAHLNIWYNSCQGIDMEKKFEVIENDKNLQADDFYVNFKEKLMLTHTFPTNYIFKFIVPAEQATIAKLHAIYENAEANISSRDSKNGKYTSLTIKTAVNDADDVIIYYRQAASIEGIVML